MILTAAANAKRREAAAGRENTHSPDGISRSGAPSDAIEQTPRACHAWVCSFGEALFLEPCDEACPVTISAESVLRRPERNKRVNRGQETPSYAADGR